MVCMCARVVGCMSGEAGAHLECKMIHRWHPITPPSRCTALGMVEPELVGLPVKALTRDATRRLRFVVNAAGWLHSMVLHGRTFVGSRSLSKHLLLTQVKRSNFTVLLAYVICLMCGSYFGVYGSTL